MSARTFGPHFRPQDFKGPYARNYPDREDLFQHLVGAALQEFFTQRVSITSTKGRDGGVDIFIEASEDSSELFCGLRFPIIIECKDHDDSLGNVTRNIEAGWSKVQQKLARQAKAGWEGLYQPWRRTKGYLYCVSAVLNQQARDMLTKSIKGFFFSLPSEQKLSIENIHVLDWSDVASLLNRHTRLADAWLGTDLEGIIGHDAYEDGLSGFRLYLKEDHLPFIFPIKSDPAHPTNLFASLEREASTAGILLVGPGGVGKTRTCFEVARVACRRGWRVLHLLPGEPPVTTSCLQEIVLQGVAPTLLVIDYLDQMESLDMCTIRYRLFPEVRARRIPLAILANARLGALHKEHPERDALFRRIELDIRDRRSQIAAHLQNTIAPMASGILGSGRVREICGTRPIIGVFIARELERYAQEHRLNECTVSHLRQGDLQGWIRKRFQEDGLSPRETHPLLPPSPDLIMIAAAAGLAAAPLRRIDILRIVHETLQAAGEGKAKEIAGDLVASLLRSGWLEEAGYYLTTANDVIADELLELTLCDRESHTVRCGMVDKVLIGALSVPSVLGRFSKSLDRLLGQEDSSGELLQRLRETVEAWLSSHASELGQMLKLANPREVSYALGAVVSGDVWSDAVIKSWNDLVAPWLALYGRSSEACHLLYRGLKNLPEASTRILVDTSLQWLDVHYARPEAEFVLSSLLSRFDLGERAKPTIGTALAWLNEHGSKLDAQFILHSLLPRVDLGEQAKPAIDTAMAWLKEHGLKLEAGFVLPSLLSRVDLGEQAKPAIDSAMAWLKEHGSNLDAQFTLHTLIPRVDLGEQAKPAIDSAMAWLKEHGSKLEAGFVLHSLLPRVDLGEQAKPAIETAMVWLKEHGSKFKAGFTLYSLLQRVDLGDQAKPAIDSAVAWLKEHGSKLEAGFVLRSLLPRVDLGDQAKPAIKTAMVWLKEHGLKLDAQSTLYSLLQRVDLGDQAKPAIDTAMAWLKEHGSKLEAGFVLSSLLPRIDLGEQAKPSMDVAMAWLEHYFLTQDAEFVLKNLLGKSHLSEDRIERCISLALKRLDKVIETNEASYLLRSCLSEQTLSGEQLKRTISCALNWLRLNVHAREIDYVFNPLLRNPNLDDKTWRDAANYAFVWLKRTPLSHDRDHTLNSLLARSSCLTQEERAFVRQDAQTWLKAFPNERGNERLVRNLQRSNNAPGNRAPSIVPKDNRGSTQSASLSLSLLQYFEEGKLPSNAILDQGLEMAQDLLKRNRPGSAAYILSSLLPLAVRNGDPAFTAQVAKAIRMLFMHPSLTKNQRRGFTRALCRLLDSGVLPNGQDGERLLLSLGIRRVSDV